MTEKKKNGRPTKYKEEYEEQSEKLCRLGATDKDLADFFKVDEATINRWKERHPKFCESLKDGKSISDGMVEQSLFKRATGYEHPDTQFNVVNGELIKTDITKHYPPDATSMIFWLKNRQKEKWRDKVDHEHTGENGGPIQTITRVIVDSKS